MEHDLSVGRLLYKPSDHVSRAVLTVEVEVEIQHDTSAVAASLRFQTLHDGGIQNSLATAGYTIQPYP